MVMADNRYEYGGWKLVLMWTTNNIDITNERHAPDTV